MDGFTHNYCYVEETIWLFLYMVKKIAVDEILKAETSPELVFSSLEEGNSISSHPLEL